MYYISNYELYHHGIKGQRWGIRRYQNYDGSYTKAGLERYNRAKSELDNAKVAYKEGRISKDELLMAKHNEKQAYKNLKRDFDADEGKLLSDAGVTLQKARTKRIGGAAGAIGSALLSSQMKNIMSAELLNEGKVNPVSAGIYWGSRISTAIFAGVNAGGRTQMRKLQAYYSRRGSSTPKEKTITHDIVDGSSGKTTISDINSAHKYTQEEFSELANEYNKRKGGKW